MKDCVVCGAGFPSHDWETYLDIYGVCRAPTCQVRKCRMIVDGVWFKNDHEMREFERFNEVKCRLDALSWLVFEALEEDKVWGGALRILVSNESKRAAVGRIIEYYEHEIESSRWRNGVAAEDWLDRENCEV